MSFRAEGQNRRECYPWLDLHEHWHWLITSCMNFSLVICKNSPAAPATAVNRVNAGFNRVAEGRHKAGTAKVAHRKAAVRGGWNVKGGQTSITRDPLLDTGNADLERPAKRRRLHSDAKVIAGLV